MTLRTPDLASDPGVMDRALDRAAGSRSIPGNLIRHLTDGPEAFAAMGEAIEEAGQCIHFENYIIRDDTTGRRFADLLIAAARRGVAVRVLYDALGSRGTGRAYWRQLRKAGIEVRAFSPVSPFTPIQSLRRDHRKYVAADGLRAVVGGLCIGDEWTGDPARQRRPWRDTAVDVCGPAVAMLEVSFARVWTLAGAPLPATAPAAPSEPCGRAVLRVIEGVPGRLRMYRTIQLLASGAAERLWITDAYLLPPQAMYAALVAAARDGVDVRLLLPGRSDIPPLSVFARVGYRELLRAGARIWEWRGPMLHAKTVIVDGSWFKVGSSNLNASSLRNNYELDLLIEDDGLATDAADQFRIDLSRSVEVVLRQPRWAKGRLARRVPPVARHTAPSPEVRDHLPGALEVSHRAVVTLRQVASGARRSLAGATVFGLVGVGVLFLTLPHVMAYLLAFICFTVGGRAAWLFVKRRRETDE
ncbi:MAG: cardiolipin synthase B [Gemmatimonadetes bacterium]|nr:cardiolipin synthase B [Gemmatimonadota bacterium]